MTAPPAQPRIVPCPACGGRSEYSSANPWRPFCSERCKNHDFGAWASERYRVGETAATVDENTDSVAPPHH